VDNISCYNLNDEDLLRKVTVKIGLERVDTQEGVMVEALLDSGVTGLVMSSEFARKQMSELKTMDLVFILFYLLSFLFYFLLFFIEE